MGSTNTPTIRMYFDETEWNSLSDYEKQVFVKQKQNYQSLLDLGINVTVPLFIVNYQEKQRQSELRIKQEIKANDDDLFKKPLPPKKIRPKREYEPPFSVKQPNNFFKAPTKSTTDSGESGPPNHLRKTTRNKSLDEISAVPSTSKMSAASIKDEDREKNFRNFLSDSTQKWKVVESSGFQSGEPADATPVQEDEKSAIGNSQMRSLNEDEISAMMNNVGKFKWFFEEKEKVRKPDTDADKDRCEKNVKEEKPKNMLKEETSKSLSSGEARPGRYPRRAIARINYAELDIPDEDMFVFCDHCQEPHDGPCPKNYQMVHLKDKEVPEDKKDKLRALKTVPDGLAVGVSSIPEAGDGVWATSKIPKGTLFGPYEGVFRKNTEDATSDTNNYSWEIKKERKPVGFIDAKDMSKSNWMRFVNCARTFSEQNLVAYQHKSKIYYRTFEDIPPSKELLVYYGDSFGKQLGIQNFCKEEELPKTVFECPHCFMGFSTPVYVKKHSKRCPKRFLSAEEKEELKMKRNSASSSSSRMSICSFDVCVVCKANIVSSSRTAARTSSAKCDTCIFQIKTEDSDRKQSGGSGEGKHKCPHCSKTFNHKSYLRTHERTHTGERPYSCSYCSKTFSQQSNLRTHERIHTDERPYSCSHCFKTFKLRQHLEVHVRAHTGERLYSCSHCSKTFSNQNYLRTHERTHTGERPYSCSHCSKTFTQQSNLQTHERTHTGERPYSCSHCFKTFKLRQHLQVHVRVHTGERPYSCSYCSKTFSQHNSLQDHERTHTGEKPYSCSHCSKTFSHRNYLRAHERTHTGEKPYSCSYCSKTFSQQSNLRTHERTHTSERPYSCSHCSKTFRLQHHLQLHERTHTGEKPYSCTNCSKKFSDPSSSRKHMKKCSVGIN